ncbi:1-hydroxycarotenoid 3,4-desaturase CrtD [Hydrotalea sp.]|uniref:1-hydroxycarotenoid 3,4-desaturase CrtD n=1 Tax=Hydrotalea sp. TaxID=2881279 RepID=UPI0026273264|nr:1-hydroxycarotenoid 3,4-desaturase CrtD [Hydrotalea sp.]
MQQQPSVIIIGAGVAGLAAAIRLAVAGYPVQVFEQNSYPGGKVSYFELNGYYFDAGPSLFTQPANIEALFELAGEPIDEYFQYRSLPIACRYFYEDGTRLVAYTNNSRFAEEAGQQLGEPADNIARYLRDSAHLYNKVGTLFLNFSLHKPAILFQKKIFTAVTAIRWRHLFKSLHQLNKHYFRQNKTAQLFNRYATYNGSNPYQAPGILSVIPHLEMNEGTFYPEGGMIAITNALYRLALKKGVQFHFNAPVEGIIHEHKRVRGIYSKGIPFTSNLVVSNVDTYFTYKYLLKDENAAEKINRQERSSSALIFYWGIAKTFPELDLHNIFFSSNYAAEFAAIFQEKKLYADPTIYINITAKCEPGIQAPEEKENWFVMINVPAATAGADMVAMQQQAKAAIIQKLNRLLQTDIAPLIEVEAILDPVQIETKTGSYKGALYGTSSNSKWAAFLRHPNFSKTIKGLYFVGGSVHPGGGIPLCLQSAKIMSGLAIPYIQQLQKRSRWA